MQDYDFANDLVFERGNTKHRNSSENSKLFSCSLNYLMGIDEYKDQTKITNEEYDLENFLIDIIEFWS